MVTSTLQLQWNCLMIERLVTGLVLQGIEDNKTLVEVVGTHYNPETEFEMENYSEAIIYAKCALLN
jgi:hypothetical protein